MNATEKQTPMQKSVQEHIREDSIRMKPRYYFIGKAVGLYVFLGLLFFLSLFLVSLLELILIEFGFLHFTSFGAQGFINIFTAFPWHIVLLLLVLVFIATKLLDRNIYLAYKLPRVITLCVLIGAVVAGATIVARAPLLPTLFYERKDTGNTLRSFGLFPEENRSLRWITGSVMSTSGPILYIQKDGGESGGFRTREDIIYALEVSVGDRVLLQYREQDEEKEIMLIKKLRTPSTVPSPIDK